MQSRSGSASILSTTTQAGAHDQHGVELEERVEISALSTTRKRLLQECVHRNTELLEQLTKQIAQLQDQPPNRITDLEAMIDLGADQWFDAGPVVNLGMSDEIAPKQGHKRPTVSLQE